MDCVGLIFQKKCCRIDRLEWKMENGKWKYSRNQRPSTVPSTINQYLYDVPVRLYQFP